MVKFIIGQKGTGKTKQLIDKVNEAVKIDKGHIVFINKSNRHMFDLDYQVRLIDTQDFHISTYSSLYGLICGILSQDYDISNMFFDSITKVVTDEDIKDAETALADIEKVCQQNNVNLVVTASIDASDAPEFLKKYL